SWCELPSQVTIRTRWWGCIGSTCWRTWCELPSQGGTRAQSDLNKRHRERRIGWSQESVPKYYANSLQ
ncbi:Hypothetical predicted protein, partial [Cloeon dipterum]